MKLPFKLAEILAVYVSFVVFVFTRDFFYLGIAIFFIINERYTNSS